MFVLFVALAFPSRFCDALLPNRLLHRGFQVLDLPAPRFAVGGEGPRLFSCGYWDNSIKCSLLDGRGGQTYQTVHAHSDVVTCLALAEDGSTLLSGSRDTTLMVWNLLGGGKGLMPEKPRREASLFLLMYPPFLALPRTPLPPIPLPLAILYPLFPSSTLPSLERPTHSFIPFPFTQRLSPPHPTPLYSIARLQPLVLLHFSSPLPTLTNMEVDLLCSVCSLTSMRCTSCSR